ncbi:uncharacterized protein LOC119687075 [Teleopsis dalmanni]|uniref:uncharacterized protein LOC119687075 n=1 Tax=Teleopsis dalmanni TaxID=139649 RepID=UPI0018CFE78B|nr:uncharacterized protein LOC119687075 [Teleopsis dalmanni]XP_037957179.1 uncharacterized protein LOC119687075 [Teleopsis dalmanni]
MDEARSLYEQDEDLLNAEIEKFVNKCLERNGPLIETYDGKPINEAIHVSAPLTEDKDKMLVADGEVAGAMGPSCSMHASNRMYNGLAACSEVNTLVELFAGTVIDEQPFPVQEQMQYMSVDEINAQMDDLPGPSTSKKNTD